MKKNYLLFATAAIVLAGCTADDDLSASKSTSPAQGDGAIMFSMNTPATTRATLSSGASADSLGNEFIVWGEKEESGAATDAKTVFKNYRVQYDAAKTNTTVSNTHGWEYVGITPYASDQVNPAITGTQTIKYWDENAPSYTFTAVSAHDTDLANKRVTFKKNHSETTEANKGYDITVGTGANPNLIYVSDRKTITKPTSTVEANQENTYKGYVKLQFRNFMSKVRFGIYENIPGYRVVITNIKYNSTDHKNSTDLFGVDGKFITPGNDTKYKVTYYDDNKAKVTLDGTPASTTYLSTTGTVTGNTVAGTPWLSTSFDINDATKSISETSASPTYDRTDGAYTTIMPCYATTSVADNLTLTVDYDLYSTDTGEKISVTNKTAVVPAAYCQWKSNYAYTYIFKITDKSAELYPITFDAVVETNESDNQETITTVSGATEPKLTTMAVGTDGKIVKASSNEYAGGNTIYASVMDVTTAATLDKDNTKLYIVTPSGSVTPAITEGSVANCIAKGTEDTNTKTWTITDLNGGVITAVEQSIADLNASNPTGPVFVDKVPTEEGIASATRNLSAVKWTGASTSGTTYYAVEYKKTVNNKDVKYYKIVKVVNQ
jgi:hypothetical protein